MAHKSKCRPRANQRKKERFGHNHPNIDKNRKGTPSRTAWAKEKRRAHPYICQKRSLKDTAIKNNEKALKRLRYLKRAESLKRLEQK